MLKSMTGFGRCEKISELKKFTIEIKAVNHRYCDISIKLPKNLSFFEANIRNLLKKYISRGKIDMFITYEDYTQCKTCVKYNEDIAKEYFDIIQNIGETFNIPKDINALALSRFPEVITLQEQSVDEEELWNELQEVIKSATFNLIDTRIKEGEQLKKDLILKLDTMKEYVNFIEKCSPKIVNEYREKIIAKVQELLNDNKVDETMLATEITIFADKICVDEETVRLKSHIEHMKATLEDGENVGRKLDFIAQEMNREANTILSKANNLEVSNMAINLKTDIEKIREQIQNIE